MFKVTQPSELSLTLFVVFECYIESPIYFLLFYFDSRVKPFCFLLHLSLYKCCLKLVAYFVKTGFNKVLKTLFFVIIFLIN